MATKKAEWYCTSQASLADQCTVKKLSDSILQIRCWSHLLHACTMRPSEVWSHHCISLYLWNVYARWKVWPVLVLCSICCYFYLNYFSNQM
jgi:hypothetical protein